MYLKPDSDPPDYPGTFTYWLEHQCKSLNSLLQVATENPSAMAREGAVLGIYKVVDETIDALKSIKLNDSSPGVRTVAAETLWLFKEGLINETGDVDTSNLVEPKPPAFEDKCSTRKVQQNESNN